MNPDPDYSAAYAVLRTGNGDHQFPHGSVWQQLGGAYHRETSIQHRLPTPGTEILGESTAEDR